jgi:hypothetical protein
VPGVWEWAGAEHGCVEVAGGNGCEGAGAGFGCVGVGAMAV